MIGFLSSLALSLGMSAIAAEASRDTANYQELAAKIIRAAQAKGQAALTKATQAINSIPMLSGSAAVRNALREAKIKANENYRNVEKQVTDMQDAAEGTAQEIQNLGSGSAIGRWIRNDKKTATDKTAQALKTIDAVNFKGENYETKI